MGFLSASICPLYDSSSATLFIGLSFWGGGVFIRGKKMKSVVAWEVLKPVSHRGVIELPGPLWPSLVLYFGVLVSFHCPIVFISHHLPL